MMRRTTTTTTTTTTTIIATTTPIIVALTALDIRDDLPTVTFPHYTHVSQNAGDIGSTLSEPLHRLS